MGRSGRHAVDRDHRRRGDGRGHGDEHRPGHRAPGATEPHPHTGADPVPRPDAPVRHRYVHGGFKGTDTRFSFYLPPKEQYQGRFFQHITPAPDSENLAQLMPAGEFNKIGSSIAAGAYFVETNGGGKTEAERTAYLESKLQVPLSENMIVQSHTPFADLKQHHDKCVLVVGGDYDHCISEISGRLLGYFHLNDR